MVELGESAGVEVIGRQKSAILAFSDEISGQSSEDVGQPSPDVVQGWSGAGILECIPETLGELYVHLAGTRGTGGRGDEQRDMLIPGEVQWFAFIVSPERSCVRERPSKAVLKPLGDSNLQPFG
jgi:hypothetical protein